MAAVLSVAFAMPASADEGYVLLRDGKRLSGTISLSGGGVKAGEQSAAWDDVACVFTTAPCEDAPGQVLRFKNGDVWPVSLASATRERAVVNSSHFGDKFVDIADLAAIDFTTQAPAAIGKSGALYRMRGEPVPGALMWIDATRLAIDSPLGALTINRKGLARYVFSEVKAAPGPADEVTLTDGTVLVGKLKLGDKAQTLEYSTLGALALAADKIKSIVRGGRGVVSLTDIKPSQWRCSSMLRGEQGESDAWDKPASLAFSPGGTDWDNGRFLRAVRVEAGSKATYRLPDGAAAFSATLCLPVGSRGAVTVRLIAGDRVLHESQLSPVGAQADAAEKPKNSEDVTVDLPSTELTIEVVPDGGARFPAGALLGDPCVRMK